MVESSTISPRKWAAKSPAMLATDAVSTKFQSLLATNLYPSIIFSSVTETIQPPLSSLAFDARSKLAGAPMRMAVAIVSGLSTGIP